MTDAPSATTAVPPLVRIARSSAVLLSGDAVARVLLFVTTVLAARRLGPEAFGVVSFAQAVLGYLLLAGDWGLATYGIRELARDPRSGEAWWAISRVRAGIAISLFVISAAVVAWSPGDGTTRTVLLLTLASAVPAALLPDWAARGFGRMRMAAVLGVVQPALVLVAIAALVHGPADVARVPLARLLALMVAVALGFALLQPATRGGARAASAWLRERGVGTLLRSGGVLLLANAAVLAYNSADQLLLHAFTTDHEVGLYGSAYRIIQLPMAALYAVTASALPVLTRLHHEDPAGARAAVRRLSLGALAGGIVVAGVIFALRAAIVTRIYGAAFAAAAAPLGVLAFAVPLDFVVSVKGTSYIAAGRERGTLVCVVLGAATNILANLAFIPRGGMMAAAWVTLASYGVILAAYAVFMDSRRS